MKLKIIIAFSAVALLAVIALSQMKSKPFAPAEDFPRAALIYVQIADLPAFVKLWNESNLKEKYTTSANFDWFRAGHLGLKLASRWDEFNAATGFPVDLETVSKLTNNEAAIAVYDIGKLEFVFVAPVSEEIFAATKFVQNKDKFTEETLDDGTTIYRASVEADRGRQKQELIFANIKGRFVLATSEKLLMQTLNNINGKGSKNRLIDEPDFKVLSEKTAPHTAAVWLNQTALNDDYYFKHYWLMSDLKELKNIRAGIFDFEIQQDKLVEKRRFLLNETVNAAPISDTQANEMLAFLPENIPFYKLQKAGAQTVNQAFEQTIFERPPLEEKTGRKNNFSADDGYTSENYGVMSEKFDDAIDEIEDVETVQKPAASVNFSTFLQSAEPQAVLIFTSPQISPAPRFVEFRRAAIFNLAAPNNFNRSAFEAAIEQKMAAQILIAAPNVKLNWETKTDNDISRRELILPMLGQTIGYVLRGSQLILTDDADFLREIAANPRIKSDETSNQTFNELTVVNFEPRAAAYDEIFNRFADETEASGFFTGNISSLLDSISEVKRVEIRKNFSRNTLDQELIFVTR